MTLFKTGLVVTEGWHGVHLHAFYYLAYSLFKVSLE